MRNLTIIILLFASTFINAQTFTWDWAEKTGGINDDRTYGVTTDCSGDVIVTGYFSSPNITIGSNTLLNEGESDIFLAKYDSNGNTIWAKSFGGISHDKSYGVATDTIGNIFIAGRFYSDTIIFATDTLTNIGGYDMFIAKLDSDGNVLWARREGGSVHDYINNITTDVLGNVYITGYFYNVSELIIGSDTLVYKGGGDIFLAKFDTDGNPLWANSAGGVSEDKAYSISTDEYCNVFITGKFGLTAMFNDSSITTKGNTDIFLAKYDSLGVLSWVRNLGSTESDESNSVVVDNSNNIYITGFYKTNMVVGSTTLESEGESDIFLIKYNTNGDVLWAKTEGGYLNDIGKSVCVNSENDVLIAGEYESILMTVGSFTLSNNGMYDIFVMKYDSTGNLKSVIGEGGVSDDENFCINNFTDTIDNVYIGGAYKSSGISFDTHYINNMGGADAFIAKLGTTNSVFVPANENEIAFKVFPNPSNGIINFDMQNHNHEYVLIEVINMKGEIIYKEHFNKLNYIKKRFDFSHNKGILLIKVSVNNAYSVKRISVI